MRPDYALHPTHSRRTRAAEEVRARTYPGRSPHTEGINSDVDDGSCNSGMEPAPDPYTDDWWRDYERCKATGVEFVRPPKEGPYGVVAVFSDLCGNRWDLLPPKR